MIVHQSTNPSDVDVDRTLVDTPAATDTHDALVVFVYKILQFMHKALADPLKFGAPGVMPGGMQGKEREHTAVPVLEAFP